MFFVRTNPQWKCRPFFFIVLQFPSTRSSTWVLDCSRLLSLVKLTSLTVCSGKITTKRERKKREKKKKKKKKKTDTRAGNYPLACCKRTIIRVNSTHQPASECVAGSHGGISSPGSCLRRLHYCLTPPAACTLANQPWKKFHPLHCKHFFARLRIVELSTSDPSIFNHLSFLQIHVSVALHAIFPL